jgi:hypothetical protein
MACCNQATDLTLDNAAAKVQKFIDGDLATCEYPAGQLPGRGIVIRRCRGLVSPPTARRAGGDSPSTCRPFRAGAA